MFCYQCQETAQGKGCTLKGVCGKTAEVAGLQDLLMYLMKGISKLTTTLRKQGVESSTANKFIVDGLFMTITNANFDSSGSSQRSRKPISYGRTFSTNCIDWESIFP